jgi:hypothetical protein
MIYLFIPLIVFIFILYSYILFLKDILKKNIIELHSLKTKNKKISKDLVNLCDRLYSGNVAHVKGNLQNVIKFLELN